MILKRLKAWVLHCVMGSAEVKHPIDINGDINKKVNYCYKCGQNVNNQKYCHGCGRRLIWGV